MLQIHVHDFNWEHVEIENKDDEKDFFYTLEIYYNFSSDDPGDGWDNLTYFTVAVATPMGLPLFIERLPPNPYLRTLNHSPVC
ncbi:hypothetical protein F0L74_13225 [Chitinophaga agrisoli]|uniref:Uncharacterized protein n=1 Tax=Chitinophaga agrisoli TaxID=2607653 RepID=A0A5B2VVX5_9BACT|nr:hypothetical protein [Chitinophaga agrisoli]KAA2243451.1 hypothetical protein F0L74_13225 [Chitinophaga agrisoli]